MRLFVDYGEGLNLVDPKTGDAIKTQLFVAVFGASNYTYAEATLTQQLPDWIGSHVRAFEYFGCVPQAVVPDCLKSAVTLPCLYELDINLPYTDLHSITGTGRERHALQEDKVREALAWVQRKINRVAGSWGSTGRRSSGREGSGPHKPSVAGTQATDLS